MNKDLSKLKIDEIDLPTSVCKALLGVGFVKLQDALLYLDRRWLMLLPRVGPKSCSLSLKILQEYGIDLPEGRYRSYRGRTVADCRESMIEQDYLPVK